MRAILLALLCLGSSGTTVLAEPYRSTYRAMPSQPLVLRGATVLTATGERLDGADVSLSRGVIEAVGPGLPDDGRRSIDVSGKWITPGIIDLHSHLGAGGSPGVSAHSDYNEMSAPVTPDVWIEHSVWPQDPGFVTALAGGVTTLQVLPGSANLIGGRTVTLKNVPGNSVYDMKFPEAPHGLKMACGENPKRVYGGGKGQAPGTRMGNVAGYRKAWIEARDYREQQRAAANGDGDAPTRDLRLETLVGVLEGEILVHNHCYRADEMMVMLEIAKEFDYQVTAFHHAVEAYKIAGDLADSGTCAAVWADWWGFKMEAYDGILENAALVDAAGACTIIHSDDEYGIQRLNQETAKVIGAAQRVGMAIPPEHAIAWITLNPARALGIDSRTGSLTRGKMADLVVWSGDPFSVYSLPEQVYIDGALVYDRHNPDFNPITDFTLGTSAAHGGAR